MVKGLISGAHTLYEIVFRAPQKDTFNNLKNKTFFMKFKIAVCQFKIKFLDPEANLKRAEGFIKKASSKAQLIVFPENVVTGPIEANIELADSTNKYRKQFQHLAKKYKIDIVAGSIIEKEKKKLYNVSYYVDANGKIKSKYRKINLWHSERRRFSAGKKIGVCNTKYGKIGLMICWDLIFPEIFRDMARQNVKIVICPSYWNYGDAGIGLKYNRDAEVKLASSLSGGRAFENEMIIVFCNASGSGYSNLEFTPFGHSQISAPFVGAIKKLNHNKEKMFIQEIDTAILNDAEKVYKIRADLKKKLL